jgi:hypothetical protein
MGSHFRDVVGTFRYLDDVAFAGSLKAALALLSQDRYAGYTTGQLTLTITGGILPGTGADPGTPYKLVTPARYTLSLVDGDGRTWQTWVGLIPAGTTILAQGDLYVGAGDSVTLGELDDSTKTWTWNEHAGRWLVQGTDAWKIAYSGPKAVYIAGSPTLSVAAYSILAEVAGASGAVTSSGVDGHSHGFVVVDFDVEGDEYNVGKSAIVDGVIYDILDTQAPHTLILDTASDPGGTTAAVVYASASDSGTASGTATPDVSSVNADEDLELDPNEAAGYYLIDSAEASFQVLGNYLETDIGHLWVGTTTFVILGATPPTGTYIIRDTATIPELDLTAFLPTLIPTASQGHRQTVSGRFALADGTPCVGWEVIFTPTWSFLLDADGDAILLPTPRTFTTNASGEIASSMYIWGNATYAVQIKDDSGNDIATATAVVADSARDTVFDLLTLFPDMFAQV